MRYLILFFSLVSLAAAQVVTTNTNVNIPQRNASGRLVDRNILGSSNPYESLGFDANGILSALTLWDMTPSTGRTANKYLQVNSAGTALEWDDGSTATIADGDKGDITTSASGATWTIDDGAVDTGAILDGTILNSDISASAAIALTKLATDPLARANHTGTQAWSTLTGTPTTLAGYGIVDADSGAVGVIVQNDAGTKGTYTPASDSNAARGTALINAVAAAVAGDAIIVSPGTYEITTTQLVIPAGASLIGYGWQTTKIVGEKRTNNIKVANNVTIQGLNVTTVTPSNSSGHSIIGNESAAYTGVVIRDCYLEGEQDIFNGWGQYNNTDIRLVNCILVSKFDIFNHSPGTGNTITIEGCTILADGDGNPDSSAGLSGLVTHTGVTMNVRNTRIIMGEAAAGGAGPAIVGVGSGVANIQDCWLTVEAGGYDLQQTSSSTINVTGGRGSGTNGAYSTSGTITHIGADYARFGSSIDSSEITDGTIAAADIATGAVTSTGILDGTIAAGDIATGAVTTTGILDGTIANADISASAAIAKTKLDTDLGTNQADDLASPITTNPYAPTWADDETFVVPYGANGEIDLPAVAGYAKKTLVIISSGTFTITVDPNELEVIYEDGASLGAGVADSLSATAGDWFAYYCDGTAWIKAPAGGGGVSSYNDLTDVPQLLQDIEGLGDPAADRFVFWDDSAGVLTYLTPGTGLEITGTTITAPGFQEVGSFTGTGSYSEGVRYSGTMSADATITLSLTSGQSTVFELDVTGSSRTLDGFTAYRVGYTGSAATSLVLPVGRHRVAFYHNGSAYIMSDTVPTAVDLTADVTGTLPVANGGTGNTVGPGKANVLGDADTGIATDPYTLTAANSYGTVIFLEPADAGEIDLPAGVAGMNIIVRNNSAFTIDIDPNASEAIERDGTLQTGGVTLQLSAGAGNFVSLLFDGVRWVTFGYRGTISAGS